MPRSLAGLLLCALLTLTAASPAAADSFNPPGPLVDRHVQTVPPPQRFAPGTAELAAAQQLAVQHWQAVPCDGEYQMGWKPMEPTLNAWAYVGGCYMEFNSAIDWDWPKFCTVFIHEYGHLLGHQHSSDPDDVMAAYYTRPAPACVTSGASGPSEAPEAQDGDGLLTIDFEDAADDDVEQALCPAGYRMVRRQVSRIRWRAVRGGDGRLRRRKVVISGWQTRCSDRPQDRRCAPYQQLVRRNVTRAVRRRGRTVTRKVWISYCTGRYNQAGSAPRR